MNHGITQAAVPAKLAEISYDLATGQYGSDVDRARADLMDANADALWNKVVGRLAAPDRASVIIMRRVRGTPLLEKDTNPPLLSAEGDVITGVFWPQPLAEGMEPKAEPIASLRGILGNAVGIYRVSCLPHLDILDTTHVVATRFGEPEILDAFDAAGGPIDEGNSISFLALMPDMVFRTAV